MRPAGQENNHVADRQHFVLPGPTHVADRKHVVLVRADDGTLVKR
jgi:hypothetical protein